MQVLSGDLVGHGDLAHLGHGIGKAGDAVGQCVDHQCAGHVDQLDAQRVKRDAVVDRHPARGVHRSGVEPFFDLHQTDAGLGVASQDRPFHRSGPAPTRQQGEVEVDHRHHGQEPRRDDSPEGDDHRELDPGLGDVVHLVAHRDAQLRRRFLDGAGRGLAAAAAASVGPSHAQGDVVPGLRPVRAMAEPPSPGCRGTPSEPCVHRRGSADGRRARRCPCVRTNAAGVVYGSVERFP